MDDTDTTQENLAAVIGLSQGAISDWIKRDVIPKADIALKIARHFGVSVEYLIEGGWEGKDGEVVPSALAQGTKVQGDKILPFSPNKNDNVVYVPFYTDTKVSAGHGTYTEDYQNVELVPILRSFVQPYNPKVVRTLEVTGDSMIKIHLFPGDIVFFIPEEHPSDGLYVIGIQDRLFVKRLEFDITGREIRVISENDRYTTQTLAGEDMKMLRIIGKVIGWITKHPH